MRSYELSRITLRGFKSFVSPTVIELSAIPGVKYVTGINHVEPLGANGAGKTSVFDALTWCWYGYSTRGHRTSELVSWQADQAEVSTTILCNGQAHIITRTSNPEHIMLDGNRVMQDAVTEFLGLSRAACMQSVVFGQGTPNLLDMAVPARGELMDEILELQYWLEMSSYAAGQGDSIENNLHELERDMARLSGQLDGLPDATVLQQRADDWHATWRRRAEQAIDDVEQAEQHTAAAQAKLAELQRAEIFAPDDKALNALRQDTSAFDLAVHRYEDEIRGFDRSAAFYEKHNDCPTCHQPLDRAFVAHALDALAHRKSATNKMLAQARKRAASHHHAIAAAQARIQQVHKIERDTAAATAELASRQRELSTLVAAAQRALQDETNNPHLRQLEERAAAKETIMRQMRQGLAQRGRATAELGKLRYWQAAFKRIRFFQMKRAMQLLQVASNNAARALGLLDWTINFSTEQENRSGSTRSGVHIRFGDAHARPREWSPGELQRVRLAIALGMAQFIQQMRGVYYRFEVFDEPSNWLSPEGIDDMLEQLAHHAQITRRSLWLIDHRTLSYPFAEIWRAEKTAAGSTFALLRGSSIHADDKREPAGVAIRRIGRERIDRAMLVE